MLKPKIGTAFFEKILHETLNFTILSPCFVKDTSLQALVFTLFAISLDVFLS